MLLAAFMVVGGAGYYAGGSAVSKLQNPLTGKTRQIDFSSLNDIYGMMQRNFDGEIDDTKALDGAKAGLVAAGGDPYTVYLDAKSAKELENDLQGKLSGIGAEIGKRNNFITIIAPIDDTPADHAGLRPGDVVAKIDDHETTDMTVDEAVSKIRGDAGTKVKLTLVRKDTPEPIEVTITRADINVPSVKWSMKNGNIAYINVTRFGPDTKELVEKAAAELKGKGAGKVILDLRNDPGGYLDAAVEVASEFLKPGQLVVEEKTGGKSKDKLNSKPGGLLVGLPTVVLINSGSASASEIVAGALKDHKAARLEGEKSFGKGSVQEIKQLPGGAQLKVTIAHWYTPGGVNINKEGIKPDVEVKMTGDDFNAGRDPQLDRALELLK